MVNTARCRPRQHTTHKNQPRARNLRSCSSRADRLSVGSPDFDGSFGNNDSKHESCGNGCLMQKSRSNT